VETITSPCNVGDLPVETVNCPSCGRSENDLYDSLDGWNIVRCRQCGLCYTNPRPTRESLMSFYSLDYYKDKRHRRTYFTDGGSLKIDPVEGAGNVVDVESHVERRGRLLEIGAAMGQFLAIMQHRGWDVRGIELSAEAVEIAKKCRGIEMFCGTLEGFQTEERFDVICLYQTLEHVPDPAYIIERAYQLLNPGGLLVISVPNVNGFDIKINSKLRWLVYDLPRHLSHFSPQVLSERLRAAGFGIVEVDLYYPNFILLAADKARRLRRREKVTGCPPPPPVAPPPEAGPSFPPLAKKHWTWKARVLAAVSRLLPGWKFTVVASK